LAAGERALTVAAPCRRRETEGANIRAYSADRSRFPSILPASQEYNPPNLCRFNRKSVWREIAMLRHPVISLLTCALCGSIGLASEYRSIDGTNNNLLNPTWGSAGVQLLRQASGAHYADGVSDPAGAARPSARLISNTVCAQSGSVYNSRGLSDFTWQWGQFIDHDMDLTSAANPAQPLPIAVPAGDPYFDPGGTGAATIAFDRSAYDPTTGSGGVPRQQVNELTSWLDASMVYGSDPTRAAWLRTGVGGGLKMTTHATGPLLPYNDGSVPNAGGSGTNLFVAGDVRANEQVGLTAMHTLFMREHNRLAAQFSAQNPGWSDETVYQEARRMVGAEVQAITFNEFLPALLGEDAMPAYGGYDEHVDATISNAFSTAGFRLGHTMLSSTLMRRDGNGNPIPQGDLPLREAFFDPTRITDEGGIEPLLKGLAMQAMQEIDPQIIDDVRNFLFGPPGAGGFDLASLNIQRGRDHGLADYNTLREDVGLPRAASIADITTDPDIQQALLAAFGGVDEIDPWVGALAEDHVAGGAVGELLRAILVDQFLRLRDCDRFWYEIAMTPAELALMDGLRLSDIIRLNTGIDHIQDNVFFVPEPAGLALLALAAMATARRRATR